MTTPLSPAAQAIVKAFDDRYELCGPFDDWQELCIAAALRAVAVQVVPVDCGSRRQCNIHRALLAIAAELEGWP